ncbi:ComEC/Rec2 family competence protein [Swingsia samuiensis]|nr:ComEC/Rec2 family competence protein [Swingsia samuiensis]
MGALVYFETHIELRFSFLLELCAITFLLLAIEWRKIVFRSLLLAICAFFAGASSAAWQTLRQYPMPALPSHAAFVTGRVEEFSQAALQEKISNQHFILSNAVFETPVDMGMLPLQRTLKIKMRPDDNTPVKTGDIIRIRVMVHAPSSSSWPLGQDFQRDAWFSGTAGSGYALGPVEYVEHSQKLQGWQQLRDIISQKIERDLSGQKGAIASTLLVGETHNINQKTRQDFAASGLAHLLAVAGLHLGIVMATVVMMVRFLCARSEYITLYWPSREISVLIGFVVGVGYVVLTGCHLPSVRALGMAAFITMALLMRRHVMPMRSLAFVALLILLISPVSVLSISFQMSFAAVMALIAGYDALKEPLKKIRDAEQSFFRYLFRHGVLLLLTSLLAGLATLPISMYYFGAFQPWFVIANLVAVPIAALWIMPVGILALVLMPFHLEYFPLMIMGWGISGVQYLAYIVSSLPMAHQPVSVMPGWGLFIYFLGLCWLCVWRGQQRLWGILPILIGSVSFLFVTLPDILISSDGGLIAVNEKSQLLVSEHNSLENPVLKDWVQVFAKPVATLSQNCTDGVCHITRAQQRVLIVLYKKGRDDFSPSAEECLKEQIIVSAVPIEGKCHNARVIDRFSVWREGAFAIYVNKDKSRILSDRTYRGAHSWIPQPGFKGVPNLPLALSE